MADLAGTQPARHDERDDGFRPVLRIALPRRNGADPGTGDRVVQGHRDGHLADVRRADREWFFEDQHGRQYSPSWLIAGYHVCCELAGGIAPASTPYTLRHNYATRTLMRWVEEGKDI